VEPRKRLARLREARAPLERLELAQDKVPGTDLDGLVKLVIGAARFLNENRDVEPKFTAHARTFLEGFGIDVATAIADGNAGFLRRLADATEVWHRHRPNPDKLRAALVRYCASRGRTYSLRELLRMLPENGVPAATTTAWNVRRVARELGITIRGTAGRPKETDSRSPQD
jgi:hypothetical protein